MRNSFWMSLLKCQLHSLVFQMQLHNNNFSWKRSTWDRNFCKIFWTLLNNILFSKSLVCLWKCFQFLMLTFSITSVSSLYVFSHSQSSQKVPLGHWLMIKISNESDFHQNLIPRSYNFPMNHMWHIFCDFNWSAFKD